ncbi:hypothetical protein ACFQER_10525 [Halomicroarcula sp. GCM10025894]|uniref:hypothetical protein n=1 Tax=Halomicroarcula sp. GCM10025894 TaxID=3252673 RepID=UPI0036088019
MPRWLATDWSEMRSPCPASRSTCVVLVPLVTVWPRCDRKAVKERDSVVYEPASSTAARVALFSSSPSRSAPELLASRSGADSVSVSGGAGSPPR